MIFKQQYKTKHSGKDRITRKIRQNNVHKEQYSLLYQTFNNTGDALLCYSL